MLGMIYLFLAVMLGYEGSKILTEKNNHAGYAANRIWLILPASFGVGMLVLTWIVYIVSWFASVVGGIKNPLLYGNVAGMIGSVIILLLMFIRKYKNESKNFDFSTLHRHFGRLW